MNNVLMSMRPCLCIAFGWYVDKATNINVYEYTYNNHYLLFMYRYKTFLRPYVLRPSFTILKIRNKVNLIQGDYHKVICRRVCSKICFALRIFLCPAILQPILYYSSLREVKNVHGQGYQISCSVV